MTTDLFAPDVEQVTRTERAEKAVRAFRAMQAGLSGYARAITGDKEVSIEVAVGGPRTDGKKIYFRPPIALGDLTPHQRLLCEKRDPDTLQQRCPACAVREEVLISIYHEIAHIAYGTFEKPSSKDISEALGRAIEESPGRYAEKIREIWNDLPEQKKSDYLNLSSLISPWLPILVNGLEDARVDEAMFKARRGTKVMFDALVKKTFTAGVDTGERLVKWSERDLNSQILIGVFVLACDYDYTGWFVPEVEEALADEKLRELVSRISTVRSVEGSYSLAFPILNRLRELGFCRRPEDPEEEPENDDQQDEPEDQADEPDETQADDEEDAPESTSALEGEPEAEEGDPQSDDESEADSEGSAESGDDSDDEEGSDDSEGDAGEGPKQDMGSEPGAEGEDSGDDAGSDEFDAEGGGSDSGDEGSDGDADCDESSDPESLESDGSGEADSEDSACDDELDAAEVIDTGADDGDGGIELAYGEPEDAAKDFKEFSHHDTDISEVEATVDAEAVDRAIIQGEYFETPSSNIYGVREHKYDQHVFDESGRDLSFAWGRREGDADWLYNLRHGIDGDFDVPEQILGPALNELRRVLSDNQRSKMERHLTSGRINQNVLGRRAWAKDNRLFQKKRIPGKRSYAVVIGIDISGSTVGRNLALAKRAAKAQAELLNRLGIDFAVYCHTANGSYTAAEVYLDMYEIKSFSQPWATAAKEALDKIGADAANLDGHSIEYYRRLIERHPATDKIILYYSDGKMPAENHDEELEILIREIKTCRQKGIALMGVGIRTDSPRRHGLDTVEVHEDSDLKKVIRHLEGRLIR